MKPFPWLAFFLLMTLTPFVRGQHLVSSKPASPVICYQSNHTRSDHVPVSEGLRQGRTARAKTSTFVVDYINFPDDDRAREAFQYAIEIWESELSSNVPIRVTAEWKPLARGVLGQALWGRAFANFGDEQHVNTFYPAALAEKIAGHALNDDAEADIVASFNSDASWYFGTDGKTPTGKMDLVTIVLHEIAHGLGFTDTYHVEDTGGSVGLSSGNSSLPFIFDLFVENATGRNLFHDFTAPSPELKDALESQALYFNSPLAAPVLGGGFPQLFAPSTFDDGSSISHLDEAAFDAAGDANRLMTPHIDFAESIHDPGDVLRGILADMGWVYTNLTHAPLKDTERKDGMPYSVKVAVRSDNGYDEEHVSLHYSSDGVSYTTLTMTPTGNADEFTASLPGTTKDMAYAYYISATDAVGRAFMSPGTLHQGGKAPEQATHFFNIGVDTSAPAIAHQPVTFVLATDPAIAFNADVTDNMGVREVVVEYAVNGGAVQTRPMINKSGTDTYSATVDFPGLAVGDRITYRLIARDLAASENIIVEPAGGFYTVSVNGIVTARDSYLNDFNTGSSDFFGNSFSIVELQGFANGAIHSDHPYGNGAGVNRESHYVYQLQVPIRIDAANPVITFDEIVLVEPGQSGATFGAPDFFDYVVVEGSSDGGKTWEPFGPGYDSRDDERWFDRYNEDIEGDDSQSAGDSTLFRRRTIDMTANKKFAAGDEVLVRFRLFADALAHGWGWAIDNLSIQGPVTALEEAAASRIQLYPVPADDVLFVELPELERRWRLQIIDATGRVLLTEEFSGKEGHNNSVPIDLRRVPPGLYFLQAATGVYRITKRFSHAGR